MDAVAHKHARTRATSLMRVNIVRPTSVHNTYCLGHCKEENEIKIKNIKLNSYRFSLTFGKLLLV